MTDSSTHDTVRGQVRKRYASIAKSGGGCGAASSCCAPDSLGKPDASAKLGYSAADLGAVPAGANLGLGCGNPQAIAALKPGETVLDLGSGGGFDCFLAARQVGQTGQVVGVDMTPEMVSKARANAVKGGYANVDFRLGEIEHLPVADSSVDAILSNCVINLSPDKPQVYREAFRVLRPGGRLAISDVVAVKPLPPAVRSNSDALCGCIAGAATVADLERILAAVGFTDIQVQVKEESRAFIQDWFPGRGLEEYVRSAAVTARKDAPGVCCSVPAAVRETGDLDDRTQELIAIGAAVAAHCQPCLTYHLAQASSLAVAASHIQAAIATGQRVEKGAAKAMREFAASAVGAAAGPPAGCCSGTPANGRKSCCS